MELLYHYRGRPSRSEQNIVHGYPEQVRIHYLRESFKAM